MLAFLLALLSAIAIPAKPAKYVTDNAHVLDAARASALNEKLAQFERDTSNQILVYVDHKLPPDSTIEQMGSEAMHQWGVGQKGKDNGAVLFLFTDDHKMRIEVGYGLEASLTDAKSRQITSTIIKPRLQAGDFTGAIEQGAVAMMAAARGEELKGTGQTVRQAHRALQPQPQSSSDAPTAACVVLLLVIATPIVIVVVVLRRKGSSGATYSGLATPYVSDPDPSTYGSIPPRQPSTSFSPSSSSSSSDSSSDSGSDSSSSSDDSGFDGGGGDAGGGGASDSW